MVSSDARPPRTIADALAVKMAWKLVELWGEAAVAQWLSSDETLDSLASDDVNSEQYRAWLADLDSYGDAVIFRDLLAGLTPEMLAAKSAAMDEVMRANRGPK